jgi:REP element-mobilizing transposase RayT
MVDHNFKPKRSRQEYGWHNRGYLRHFDAPEQAQFITFRLFDSMPQELLDKWRNEVPNDVQFRKRIERYLDAGYGSCWLGRADIASVVRDSLYFHDGKKYELGSWVIMPNHVHVLLAPLPDYHLPEIEHSIKSFTANEANKILARKGQFWAIESFDRYIRDSRHYRAVTRYIENNPVKARLCRAPEEWRFGSAFESLQIGT